MALIVIDFLLPHFPTNLPSPDSTQLLIVISPYARISLVFAPKPIEPGSPPAALPFCGNCFQVLLFSLIPSS